MTSRHTWCVDFRMLWFRFRDFPKRLRNLKTAAWGSLSSTI
jgi:hypothetical protein